LSKSPLISKVDERYEKEECANPFEKNNYKVSKRRKTDNNRVLASLNNKKHVDGSSAKALNRRLRTHRTLIQLCPYLQFSTMSTLKFYGDSNWPKIH
jgi:hypothetical protein